MYAIRSYYAQDHHHEHREKLRTDRADGEPFPFALQQINQRLETVNGKQQENAIEEVEVPPAIVEDRARDHRKPEKHPYEGKHDQIVFLLAREQLLCFAAKRLNQCGDVANEHQREHEQRRRDRDHHGDVVPRHRTLRITHIEHVARPVREVGRARVDIV